MARLVLLSYHMGAQGSHLNMLDFNAYVQSKGKQTSFYTKDKQHVYRVIRQTKRPYRFNELDIIDNYEGKMSDITFTDFKTLIKFWKEGKTITCDTLYVFDNNELSYHLNDMKDAKFYHEGLGLNGMMKEHIYKKVIFFMPPSNIDTFSKKYPDFKCQVFFKKINYDMLKKIKYGHKDILWYRFDDDDVKDEVYKKMISKYGAYVETRDEYDEINLWDYKGMIYYRRKHLNYYEQFGRLVFEFIMLGKEVHFLEDPFGVEDGLADYLKHYGIEFDENYKVITKPEHLINQMITDYEEFKGVI